MDITLNNYSIKPMKLELVGAPFNDKNYIFELKFDGLRCLAYVNNGITLINRRQKNITAVYPELKEPLLKIKEPCILDGEIVILNNAGYPDFKALQERSLLGDSLKIDIKSKLKPAAYVVYDILYYKNAAVIDLPLMERKSIIEDLVTESDRLIISRYTQEEGVKLYEAVKRLNLEGVVAKKTDSPYVLGNKKSDYWLKIKNWLDEDFYVCAYVYSSKNVMSVLIASLENKRFVYRGSVVVHNKLEQKLVLNTATVKTPHFKTTKLNVVWLKPKLICTVEFLDYTKDNMLRQPLLKGIRLD